MKILFVIDKPQTFQIIDSMIAEATKNHHVFVHAYFDVAEYVPNNVHRKTFNGLGQMIDFTVKNEKIFDVIFAINHFNPGWSKLHQLPKCVGLEYCWNEIYNIFRQTKVMPGALYANTTNTKNYLNSVLPEQRIESLGSPWFQTAKRRKSSDRKSQLTVLAPHTNFLSVDRQAVKLVSSFISKLREYAFDTGRELILKDRRKFQNGLQQSIKFDKIVYDDSPFSHISLYSESDAVIHFCSSAICELAFVETPSISVLGDIHRKLHQGSCLKPAVDHVNQQFFSTGCGDEVHATTIEREALHDVDATIHKIESMISADKDWTSYQSRYFPGDHENASKNILASAIEKYA